MEPMLGILLTREARAQGISSNALIEDLLMADLWPRCCGGPRAYSQTGPDMAGTISHHLTCPTCNSTL